ncbi:transglutaminase domain-containing protein [Bradyrhizobium sp. ERR14]|uniref:transglutaminase domain-containing protein n=1 Tax=Bradyrhizobium sp. ERR14 TaxID=2663837 RepID=UPI001FEFCF28|nr:transglutaminase domain-containing protein [Bradyrhizobium sp. ERR14]
MLSSAGQGYCVGKAALYAAACRAHGIPARVGFADVKNHLTTEKLRTSMGTDIFTWHGFTEVHVDGAWRKATPTFNDTLCAKVGVAPLDFDGHTDALLHPFDGEGRAYMQYVNDRGTYHDVPAKFLMREMARDYANMQGEDLSGRDMEREAAER